MMMHGLANVKGQPLSQNHYA